MTMIILMQPKFLFERKNFEKWKKCMSIILRVRFFRSYLASMLVHKKIIKFYISKFLNMSDFSILRVIRCELYLEVGNVTLNGNFSIFTDYVNVEKNINNTNKFNNMCKITPFLFSVYDSLFATCRVFTKIQTRVFLNNKVFNF